MSKKKITLVTCYYKNPELFPEIEYWGDYLANVLAKTFPEHDVTVFPGFRRRVLDDGGLGAELADIEQDAWNDFCADGYKEYTEKF